MRIFDSIFAFKALLMTSLTSTCIGVSAARMQLERRAEFPSMSEIKSQYMRIPRPLNPCVFYNVDPAQVNRAALQNIAAGLGVGAVTIYDVYRADADANPPFNSQRYPFSVYLANDQQHDWFRLTSRAFAEVCTGRAYLIWDRQRPFHNNAQWWEAIWATDEFDAIYTGQTGITEIYIVNATTGRAESAPIWQRGQDPPNDDWWKPGRPIANNTKRSLVEDVTLVLPDAVLDAPLAKRTPSTDGIEQNPIDTVFTPNQGVGWVPGICTFHFTQRYNGPDTSNLPHFDLSLFDNEQTNIIGGFTDLQIPYGRPFAMPSRLQYTLVISPGRAALDPVTFAYAGIVFTSDGPRCKTGKYDPDFEYGARQGDCSFPCNQFQ